MKNKSRYMAAAVAVFVLAASIAGCEKGNTGTSEPEVTNVQTETEASSEVTTAAETTAETTALTTTVSETVTTTEPTTVTTEITTEEVTSQATEAETQAETEEQVQTESYSDRAHKAILGSWTVRSYVNLSYIGFTFYEDGTWEAIPVPMPLNTDPEYGSDAPNGTWKGTNGGRDYYAYSMYDENGEFYHSVQIYTDSVGYETLGTNDGMCYYNGKEHKIEE